MGSSSGENERDRLTDHRIPYPADSQNMRTFSGLPERTTKVLPVSSDTYGHGQPRRSGPPGNGNARRHGAYTLKRAVKDLGSRAIDHRITIGKALAAWRSDLLADLAMPSLGEYLNTETGENVQPGPAGDSD